MRLRYILERLDIFLLGAISIPSGLIAVLDFFGVLSDHKLFPPSEYEKGALVLLGLVGTYLSVNALRQDKFYEEFPNSIQKIISSLEGVRITKFGNSEEQEIYMARRIGDATLEVCDLSWKEQLGPSFSLGKRAASHRYYERSISRMAKDLVYKEIFVFSDVRRVEKLERRLKKELPGYSCRYFRERSRIPRLQFVLIDGEEIIFASSSYPTLCAVTHPQLGKIFQAYFDQAWASAIPIKDGITLNDAEVARIRAGNYFD